VEQPSHALLAFAPNPEPRMSALGPIATSWLDPVQPSQLLTYISLKRYDLTTLQLPTNNQVVFSINAMDLKDRLRNIETDCRDRLHV